ncbi:MAG TPA: FHA domain-containing protein [Kofleriaceae bacterium]
MKRVILVALLVLASTAHAQEEPAKISYRSVVDRVELEPSSLTGYRLRVYLTALALQGQRLDLTDPKMIKLYFGSSEKKIPFALGTYGATNSDTAIVFMVQTSIDYTDALGMIGDSLDHDLLAHLSDHTQVAVLQFGDNTGSGKLAPIKNVRGKVMLSTDNSASDPTLLDTLDRALMLLRKAKTTPEGRPLRKLVVIIGDGRDVAGDRDRITRTGTRAARDGVRIHTLAYSPNDVRRPMLALGELSKRSLGTFRWVRKATQDSWKAAFDQLLDEINKQYVLTYFVDASEDLAGKKLHIVTLRTETTSNEAKVPDPMCGGAECTTGYCVNDTCTQYGDGGGRGVFGWILLIGGLGLGGAVLLGVIGYFITKNQHRVEQPPMPGHVPGLPGHVPGLPGQAPPPGVPAPKLPKQKKGKQAQAPVAQPGFLPNGRPIPALMIMSGPRTGERHLLFNGFLIGKQPGCNLILEDGYTSSQHAQIGMDANGVCKVFDRGSTNGTYVNGVRITESALQHGLMIRIGATEMRFLAE